MSLSPLADGVSPTGYSNTDQLGLYKGETRHQSGQSKPGVE